MYNIEKDFLAEECGVDYDEVMSEKVLTKEDFLTEKRKLNKIISGDMLDIEFFQNNPDVEIKKLQMYDFFQVIIPSREQILAGCGTTENMQIVIARSVNSEDINTEAVGLKNFWNSQMESTYFKDTWEKMSYDVKIKKLSPKNRAMLEAYVNNPDYEIGVSTPTGFNSMSKKEFLDECEKNKYCVLYDENKQLVRSLDIEKLSQNKLDENYTKINRKR